MSSALRVFLYAVGAIVACVLTACGSGSSSTTPANVNLVNTTDTSVFMTLSGGYELSDVASGAVTGYESVTPGVYTVSVSSENGSLQPAPSQNWPFGTAETYTVIAYQRGDLIYTYPITDDLVLPPAGFVTMDVANVSPDSGPLDVYLLPSGTSSLQGLLPSFPSVQGLTTPVTFTSGTYNIVVTAAGNQSDIRFSLLTGVTFSSQQLVALALTDTPGGTLVNAFVITQGGGAVSYPNTQSRVRVMPALPSTPSYPVVVTVGTTALATAYSGLPTQYALVTAGATITNVTANAAQITTTLPATALTAGQDYSILVYGDGSPPGTTAVLLPDSNLVIPNYASVRVVNGAATDTGGVNLFVDGSEAATGVLEGTASGYTGVTPTASADLQLIGVTYNQSVTGYNLVTGNVYTVFLYSSTAPPIITQDR